MLIVDIQRCNYTFRAATHMYNSICITSPGSWAVFFEGGKKFPGKEKWPQLAVSSLNLMYNFIFNFIFILYSFIILYAQEPSYHAINLSIRSNLLIVVKNKDTSKKKRS